MVTDIMHSNHVRLITVTVTDLFCYVCLGTCVHIVHKCNFSLPSSKHHLSYDDCLEDKRENIRTVLCCVVYEVVHSDTHTRTCEQFLS